MSETVYVNTGEVRVSKRKRMLVSNAIGSCVAVAAFDSCRKVGGLAHIMLPGAAPKGTTFPKTRYSYNALRTMFGRMKSLGAKSSDIKVCLVGAGNILKRKNDSVCKANIKSVIEILNKMKIIICARSLGGTERRSIKLNTQNGFVWYKKADYAEKVLWKPKNRIRVRNNTSNKTVA